MTEYACQLLDIIYKISLALVTICDNECSDYGFDKEYEIAKQYVKNYEEDHKQ